MEDEKAESVMKEPSNQKKGKGIDDLLSMRGNRLRTGRKRRSICRRNGVLKEEKWSFLPKEMSKPKTNAKESETNQHELGSNR